MREIKFRAWDEKEKCWVVGFAIHQNGMFSDWAGCKEVNGKCYADANWEQLKNIPHIKIMQYTGLKDKNGKEIYEGDILLCTGKKGYWPERETVYKKSVIEWWQSHCNLGYRLRDGRGKTLMVKPSSLRTMQVEVIGNIYENPELLEGEE